MKKFLLLFFCFCSLGLDALETQAVNLEPRHGDQQGSRT